MNKILSGAIFSIILLILIVTPLYLYAYKNNLIFLGLFIPLIFSLALAGYIIGTKIYIKISKKENLFGQKNQSEIEDKKLTSNEILYGLMGIFVTSIGLGILTQGLIILAFPIWIFLAFIGYLLGKWIGRLVDKNALK